MSFFKPAQAAMILIVGGALAACGGSASGSVAPNVAPATPSASAASAPASASAAASTSGAASAAASSSAGGASSPAAAAGPSAPGPYTQNGTVTETGGAASIQATDALKWQPNTIMAKPGDKVTLSIQNTGNTAHSFVSPALGVSTGQAVPIQKTTTVSFTAPSKTGTYQFWCDIPGHAEAGMVGEVIVQ